MPLPAAVQRLFDIASQALGRMPPSELQKATDLATDTLDVTAMPESNWPKTTRPTDAQLGGIGPQLAASGRGAAGATAHYAPSTVDGPSSTDFASQIFELLRNQQVLEKSIRELAATQLAMGKALAAMNGKSFPADETEQDKGDESDDEDDDEKRNTTKAAESQGEFVQSVSLRKMMQTIAGQTHRANRKIRTPPSFDLKKGESASDALERHLDRLTEQGASNTELLAVQTDFMHRQMLADGLISQKQFDACRPRIGLDRVT